MKRWLYVCFLFYVVLIVADAQVRTESSGDSALKVELTNIKFNHDTASSASDAINIRQDYSTPIDISNGEWVKGGANHPVTYTADKSVTIKARFTVEPDSITSADIWASSTDSDGSLGDVVKTTVMFSGGISVGDANGYVELPISGNTPSVVKKTTIDTWQWKAENINGASMVFKFDVTGPHTVYSILNEPVTPWVNTAENQRNAWTVILDYACSWAATAADEHNIVAKITAGAYFGFGKEYDRWTSKTEGNMCHLSGMLNSSYVDCRDMSAVVQLFSQILGGPTVQIRMVMGPFEFKPILAIGKTNWVEGDWNFHQFGWHAGSVNDACIMLNENAPYIPVHDALDGNYKENLCNSPEWAPWAPEKITAFY